MKSYRKSPDKRLADANLELTNNPTYQIMQAQEDIGKKNVDMQKWALCSYP